MTVSPPEISYTDIDGAHGEGGGQILRSSLTLSILTGQPVHIYNIRAHRSKPGLKAQHLSAIKASAAISNAETEGVKLNSTEIYFSPRGARTGRYHWDIGTAGATTLVLQTVLLPLSSASSASSLIITGGTHVPWSPCFNYIDLQWLSYMRKIGFDADCYLDRAGFYPQGGGRIQCTIRPHQQLKPIHEVDRGAILRISGISAVANLNIEIAERQKRHAIRRLQANPSTQNTPEIRIKTCQLPSIGKGTVLLLHAQFEQGSCCFYGLGEKGKPAEQVANEAVDAVLQFIETQACIDHYLADQLILPLSIVGHPSTFTTNQITEHLVTNANVLGKFMPVTIEISGSIGQTGTIRITPL